MTLADIIALAKQGYKPSDIKELLSLATEPEPAPAPEPQSQEPSNAGQETANQLITNIESEKEGEVKKEKSPPLDGGLQEVVEDLKKQLAEAQEANVNANVQPEQTKSLDDELADMFREYM